MARKIGLGTALAVLFGAAVALAGTPFGGDDTGFVPPTLDVLLCENRFNSITTNELQCLIRCHLTAATVTFNTGKPFDDEECETSCSAQEIRALSDLYAQNICPPCITQVDPAALAASSEQGIDAQTGGVACAGTTPYGGDDSGFVAPSRAVASCEIGVGRNISRLYEALTLCSIKQANAAFRGLTFDEEGCDDAAEKDYDAANGRLTGCPSCLGAATQKAFGAAVRSGFDSGNGDIYCASPGGAFLDDASD
jgi:hypothetical protein